MLTTDLALIKDPEYRKISERFAKNADAFNDAFARAWYKLTHRDMGPHALRPGGCRSAPPQVWQDPVPDVDHPLINDAGHQAAQEGGSRLGRFRGGPGVHGLGFGFDLPRQRQARRRQRRPHSSRTPQKDWEANEPKQLAKVLAALEKVQEDFNAKQSGGKKVSMADLIVLGGCAGR